MYYRIQSVHRQRLVYTGGNKVDKAAENIAEPCSHRTKRYPEDKQHYAKEKRYGKVLAGQDIVYLDASDMLLAFAALYHRLAADLLYKGIAHIGKGGVPVHVKLLFHFGNAVLYHFKLVFVELQLFVDVGVVLHKLRRREAGGHIRKHGVVLYHMRHGVYAAVYRSVTEVKPFRLFLFFGVFNDL